MQKVNGQDVKAENIIGQDTKAENTIGQDGCSLDNYKQLEMMLELRDIDANEYSPLVLAYMGDCVYELFIRTIMVNRANQPVDKLNRICSHYAKAVTQSKVVKCLMDDFTEQEMAIYKRGRNAKSPTKAKNATMTEYRMATGFEAVVGYLYMTKQIERLTEIVKKALEYAGAYGELNNDKK